jgi:hypothetical protein
MLLLSYTEKPKSLKKGPFHAYENHQIFNKQGFPYFIDTNPLREYNDGSIAG